METSVVVELLKQRSEMLLAQPYTTVKFTHNPDSDVLLNDLERYPHAFVIACLMGRQWLAERCWLVPFRFKQRLGSFLFADLIGLSQEEVLSQFVQSPPLHRMKEKMAAVFYSAIQLIGHEYSGDASKIWEGKPSSATIVRRFLEFDGAGPKIATMAANILVRDFKVPVSDKYSIDVSPDVQMRRTFERLGLVRVEASNEELVYTARELNPDYPGVVDLAAWEIGRDWGHPKSPECEKCYMRENCPTANGTLNQRYSS